MNKRHYTEVAEILRTQAYAPTITTEGEDAVRNVTLELALMFKRDNPRFDAGKFFDAAGFPELTGTRMGLN